MKKLFLVVLSLQLILVKISAFSPHEGTSITNVTLNGNTFTFTFYDPVRGAQSDTYTFPTRELEQIPENPRLNPELDVFGNFNNSIQVRYQSYKGGVEFVLAVYNPEKGVWRFRTVTKTTHENGEYTPSVATSEDGKYGGIILGTLWQAIGFEAECWIYDPSLDTYDPETGGQLHPYMDGWVRSDVSRYNDVSSIDIDVHNGVCGYSLNDSINNEAVSHFFVYDPLLKMWIGKKHLGSRDLELDRSYQYISINNNQTKWAYTHEEGWVEYDGSYENKNHPIPFFHVAASKDVEGAWITDMSLFAWWTTYTPADNTGTYYDGSSGRADKRFNARSTYTEDGWWVYKQNAVSRINQYESREFAAAVYGGHAGIALQSPKIASDYWGFLEWWSGGPWVQGDVDGWNPQNTPHSDWGGGNSKLKDAWIPVDAGFGKAYKPSYVTPVQGNRYPGIDLKSLKTGIIEGSHSSWIETEITVNANLEEDYNYLDGGEIEPVVLTFSWKSINATCKFFINRVTDGLGGQAKAIIEPKEDDEEPNEWETHHIRFTYSGKYRLRWEYSRNPFASVSEIYLDGIHLTKDRFFNQEYVDSNPILQEIVNDNPTFPISSYTIDESAIDYTTQFPPWDYEGANGEIINPQPQADQAPTNDPYFHEEEYTIAMNEYSLAMSAYFSSPPPYTNPPPTQPDPDDYIYSDPPQNN